MEDSDLLYNSKILSYTNEAVFSLLLLMFAIWRSTRSTIPSYNIFRGKLRSLGSIFSLTSIFFSSTCICIIAYLSTKLEIDKPSIELVGGLNESYPIIYKGIKVDLAYLLNISLIGSRILRMSSVFLLIGLWGPCAYSVFNGGDRSFDIFKTSSAGTRTFVARSMFNTSVVTFAKMYAILRVPALLYYYYSRSRLMGEKTAVFLESFLLGSEVYLSVALLLILRTKHSFLSEYKSLDSTNLLSFCLMLHGFLTYTINTVAIPFEMTDLHYQIEQSLSFGARLILDMLLISMFCPIRDQLFDNFSDRYEKNLEITRVARLEDSGPIVQEIESVIEFEEKEVGK
ncbi:hypothetical protein KMI_01g00080 [Encephalitozoon hellem]|uniref:Membrane transporter n=1 Tax=Encephalitozoon hellem TaxID=27973 RepID=A0A9Q9F7N6_ENCHE|nr:uncharacterized protein EHEL_092050 [Encephalitozoon hellem ATCC 50504]AFM99097.1 hypothetical protein EHEL_092050 [Encephalitozoon hellem ATCC 50504]KAG5860376.1 hypothetical protein KMI_01g00080 [Encephalitozoon hellem]UTX42503.1 putative membrane transporter [Encephalitozoon hellem]WEL37949.1 putative membrane transporter [Encephalitozoon hellem]|eukprot:XP_003888078.1 hypothetical protein EHEL_092050 [Encephalitozoon hellem ATCC 50504]